MKPTITILDYLLSGRNTWLKHNEECVCEFDELAAEYFDAVVPFKDWCEVVVVNGMTDMKQIRRTSDEWNEICGPAAEVAALQAQLETYMNAATEIMALQASKERQSSE